MSTFNDQLKRSKGLLHGEYRAVVIDVADPDKLMRAKIRLIGLWDDLPVESLPWAEYKLPIGARLNEGGFDPCLVGDYVWVDFVNGDTRCPRITGSCHYCPDGVPNMPHEAFVGESIHEHKRHEDEPKPPAPLYHEAVVFSRFGVLIEIAPDSSYRLTHKASGTAFEFTKDGHSVSHTEGDTYRSGTGKVKEHFDGDQLIKVKGVSNTNIVKAVTIDADDHWTLNVGGNCDINVDGHATIDATTIKLNEGSPVVTTAHICSFTGKPHSDGSSTVSAGK